MQETNTNQSFWRRVWERVAIISISWVTIGICLTITFFVASIMLVASVSVMGEESSYNSYTTVAGDEFSENYLLSIPVSGMITGSEQGSGSIFDPISDAYTSGYTVKEQLKAATEDDTIDGVILEIDSPGGTIYGARAIADGVKYYQ